MDTEAMVSVDRETSSRPDRRKVWAVHAAGVATAAVLGAAASGPSTDWYRKLDTPSWQPPPSIFGPVWTGLYAMIAYAGVTVWQSANQDSQDPERGRDRYRDRNQFAIAYAANLALNAGWTWTFFRARRLPWAAVHAVVLEASTIDLVRRARRTSPRAAAALLPYAAWNAFAAALSTDLARRNR